MVVARASGTLMASSLKQNKFSIWGHTIFEGSSLRYYVPPGHNTKVKNVFCFKLDAKPIPEALATTILILLKFSIVLVHRQNPGASAHPDPSDTPHPHPIRTPSAPHRHPIHHPKPPTDPTLAICPFFLQPPDQPKSQIGTSPGYPRDLFFFCKPARPSPS